MCVNQMSGTGRVEILVVVKTAVLPPSIMALRMSLGALPKFQYDEYIANLVGKIELVVVCALTVSRGNGKTGRNGRF